MTHSHRSVGLTRALPLIVGAIALVLATPSPASAGEEHTWDLTDLYPDNQAWEQARQEVPAMLGRLEPLRGTLGQDASKLKQTLDLYFDMRRSLNRLAVYASLLSDSDTREQGPQGMKQTVLQMQAEFNAKTAWIDPEVLSLPADTIRAYLATEPGLAAYRRHLEKLEKKRLHTLGSDAEEILGLATLLDDGGQTIGGLLLDAEIPWQTITLADGSELRVDPSGYTKGRSSSNRLDRIRSYDVFYRQLDAFQQTLAAALATTVKEHVYKAQARKYEGSLDRSLSEVEVDPAVYRMLIAEVNSSLPALHRYLKLRARMLGVSDLGYHDLYPPLVGSVEDVYPWERSKQLVLEAFAPMGLEYVAYMRHALESRWVDVYPRTGKSSGAYMAGSAYDVHPYMLLNHQDDYLSASTLAHEAGHMMHSALSSKAQPYAMSDYETFVAEVASVTAEWLFFKHSLTLADNDQQRLAILGNFLEAMRTTVFRQTMFAEFELEMHEMVERGEPITGESLSRAYLELLRRYHGHHQGVCRIDDLYQVEWAFIPHFHYNFYVYSYATSFIAATAFQEQILSGENGGVERYVSQLLEAGASKPPTEILRDAGVDMTTPAPIRAFVAAMNDIMDQIEEILDRQAS